MLRKYDAIEVRPCVQIDEAGRVMPPGKPTPTGHLEQCQEDDPNIVLWGVYGHVPHDGLEAICDCYSRAVAYAVAEALEAAIRERATVI